MPLYIAYSKDLRKNTDKIFSIHEIDYMVTHYLEILKLAQAFQPGGDLHNVNIPWGESVVLEGFKFLLEHYRKTVK